MTAAGLYASAQWRHYSREFLKVHPACFRCGGKAQAVDHALSSTERPDLFWEPANHRPACRSCHAYLSLHVNGVRSRREGRK